MGSNDLSLRVILQAQDLASGKLRGFGSVISSLSGPAGVAVGALLAVVGAVVGIGAKAIQMAGQYDQSMRMVQSLTGASSQQMAYYDAQLKQLAMNAGVAPNALAQGLYQVISAGYSGANAMKVLTLATEDSKIGMTDAKTTAEALTNVLANFSWQTKDANQVNGIMLETVTLGKSTFQQYASSITKASSTSAQFHISLQTMSAAWATMTANGISAGKASTDYVQLVQAMDGKIGTITKSLHKNGIAFDEAKFNAMSFGDKVKYLNQALQQASQKHVQVTGVTLQASQALTVISGHMSAYNSDLATLSDKQAMANKTSQAWAITQGGFNQTMSRLGATVQVLLIDIGQQLLPVLTRIGQAVLPVISNFATWITKSGIIKTGLDLLGGGISKLIGFVGGLAAGIGNVVNFFQKNQVAALALLIPLGMISAVLVAMGIAAIPGLLVTIGTLIAGFIGWAAAAGAAAIATLAATWPILAIGALIGILIGIIILLWTHWKQVSGWVMEQLGRLKAWFQMIFSAIGAAFSWLGTQIHNKIQDVVSWFERFKTDLGQRIQAIIQFFQQLPGKVAQFFEQLQLNIINKLISLKNAAQQKVQDVITTIVNFFKNLPGEALQWGKDMITGLINGIKNMAGGVVNAVKDIGNKIKSFLHFSKPDTGPLVDVDQWMPDMMDLMTKGIIAGNPKLQAAVQTTARVVAGVSAPPARVSSYGSIPYGQPPISNSYSSYAGGGNHYGNNTIVIQGAGMNPDAIAKAVQDRLDRKYRSSGLMGNPARGMRDS